MWTHHFGTDCRLLVDCCQLLKHQLHESYHIFNDIHCLDKKGGKYA